MRVSGTTQRSWGPRHRHGTPSFHFIDGVAEGEAIDEHLANALVDLLGIPTRSFHCLEAPSIPTNLAKSTRRKNDRDRWLG